MLFHAFLAPPVVSRLAPPYERYEVVPDLGALAPADLPDACLLAIDAGSPGEEWGTVGPLVRDLRARFPAASLMLRLGEGADDGRLDWVRRAGTLGVRAVVADDEPPRPTLRRILTDAATLPEDLEQWLALRVPKASATVVRVVGETVRLSPGFTEISPLLRSLGHAERTVRTWFRRAGVPGPGAWLAAAHAVRTALRLQADDRAPLLTLAVDCGYSDHSSLSRQSLRLFGVRPGRVRQTLGWQWLVDRWLQRRCA